MAEKEKTPQLRLVVREAFADYRRGDEITDAKIIETVLASHSTHVIKIHAKENK